MTILEETIKNLLVKRTAACKKIRVPENRIEEVVNNLFNYVIYFNSLPEYTDRVLNKDLSEVYILSELQEFILPESVRWDPMDRRTRDLLIRSTFNGNVDSLNYSDFMDNQAIWRGFFKKDCKENLVTLDSLKKPCSFSEIVEKSAILNGKSIKIKTGLKDDDGNEIINVFPDFKSKPVNGSYIPIPLDGEYFERMFRDDYFSSRSVEVIEDYLSPVTYC